MYSDWFARCRLISIANCFEEISFEECKQWMKEYCKFQGTREREKVFSIEEWMYNGEGY